MVDTLPGDMLAAAERARAMNRQEVEGSAAGRGKEGEVVKASLNDAVDSDISWWARVRP